MAIEELIIAVDDNIKYVKETDLSWHLRVTKVFIGAAGQIDMWGTAQFGSTGILGEATVSPGYSKEYMELRNVE